MTSPKIEDYILPPQILLGVSTTFRGALEEDANYETAVPALWRQLDDIVSANDLQPLRRVGLMSLTETLGVMRYDACIPTTVECPGLSPISFPGGRYICVEHEGLLSDLATTVRWFYGEYLPTSSYEVVDGYHVELYDPRFNPTSPASILTIGAPYRVGGS